VVSAAAACVGMTGTMAECDRLAALLSHENEQVATAVEQALWTIWARQGSERACRLVSIAARLSEEEKPHEALAILDGVTAAEPHYAEAHHQRALLLHALERFESAEESYQAALRLNPQHFAAAAGLGHLRAALGDVHGALRCYRRALEINPRLAELRDITPQLEAAIRRRVVA
jgi:tetratricopeptide (TPR) repeat protein